MAGMEASTMTSEGTWRLVMPLSLLTMARPGWLARVSARSASMADF